MADGNLLEFPPLSSAHPKSDAGGSQMGEKYKKKLSL